MTAGIDVALALVEDDHGVEVAEHDRPLARDVPAPARQPEPVRRARVADRGRATPRSGGPRSSSSPTPPPTTASACSPARSPSASATCCGASSAEVGVTPARYVATARVEAARRELESSDDTVAAIAARVGFGTAESMRRTFVRDLGAAPDDYRRRFSHHRKDHAS